jgi:hypothetical protein
LLGVALLGTLLATLNWPVANRASATYIILTPQAYSTAGVPLTPVATPGPQHTYVTNIVTAQGVSTDFEAVNQTSHFKAGQQVDVLCLVQDIAKGQQHTISVHWFFDGTDMGLPMVNGKTSEEITSDQVVYFAMQYQTAGLGMAKIFFDLPSTDNGDQANDPYLAGQILFAIEPATAGTVTPAGTAGTSPTSLLNRPITTTVVALRPDTPA